MNALIDELKQLIIDSLDLEDITPSDIDAAAPLFGDGLGLDSIDALELGIAIQKRYQVKLEGDTAQTREHFKSIENLARFIQSQRNA